MSCFFFAFITALSSVDTVVGAATALFVTVSASAARVTVEAERRVRLAAETRRGAAGGAKLAQDIEASKRRICEQASGVKAPCVLHCATRVAGVWELAHAGSPHEKKEKNPPRKVSQLRGRTRGPSDGRSSRSRTRGS